MNTDLLQTASAALSLPKLMWLCIINSD